MNLDYDYVQSWLAMDEAEDIQRLRELDRADYAQTWLDLDASEEEGGKPVSIGNALEGAFLTMEELFWRRDIRDPELARLPYHEYLRTPHWRDTRRMALQRAGYQCKRCEARGKRLDVHHLTYARLGRELESDLTVLCEPCHARAHMPERQRHALERIDELERKGRTR